MKEQKKLLVAYNLVDANIFRNAQTSLDVIEEWCEQLGTGASNFQSAESLAIRIAIWHAEQPKATPLPDIMALHDETVVKLQASMSSHAP